MATGYDGSIKINTKVDTAGMTTGAKAIRATLKLIEGDAIAVGASLAAAFAPAIVITALATIAVKMRQVAAEAIQVASDLEEVQNVVDTSFGSMAYKAEEFAETAIKQFGLSRLAAKQYASTYMAMGKSMGIAMERASDMAIEVAKLTGDVASFYNISSDIAATRLKGIWTGETEALKELGVVMTVDNLEAYALSKGITKTYESMSQAEKVSLRYAFVTQSLSHAQGDFAKTSDSWANQTRILSEQWKEFLGILGSGLIRVLTPLLQVINKLLEGMIWLARQIGDLINMLTGYKETTDGLGSSADAAADSEEGLADSISKAAGAAKNALAQFDELDVLQNDLGGGSGLSFDFSDLKNLDGALDDAESEAERKKIEVPIVPVLPDPPLPKFKPVTLELIPQLSAPFYTVEDWGLVPPQIPVPAFPPLPDPIYEPNWNLAEPLQTQQGVIAEQLLLIQESFHTTITNVALDLDAAAFSAEAFQERMTEAAQQTSENVQTNIRIMAENTRNNITQWVKSSSEAAALYGQNVTTSIHDAAKNMMENLSTAYNNTYENFATWANATSEGFVAWGNSVIDIVHSTATSMRDSFLDGLSSIWDNFTEFVSATGEKISDFWSANKETIIKGAIVGAAAAGIVAAITLSGGSLIPALTAGAGLLTAVPALATGAVIPPNSEFLAILGDQKSGRNLEAPEGLIRQILREEMAGLLGDDGQTIEVTMLLDGEIIYRNQQRVARRPGKNLIKGVT